MSDTMQNAVGAFSRLSSREQIMVVVMVVALLLGAVGGITLLVGSRLDKADRRLNERRTQLATIESMESRFRAAEAEQNSTKLRLKNNNVSLFSLLNSVANEVGLKVDNLNERRSVLKEAGVDEISVDVTLKDLSITKLNKILEKLEGPPNTGLVKVTKLKIKTSFTNDEVLDVNMTVSTYKLSAGGGADGPSSNAPGGK